MTKNAERNNKRSVILASDKFSPTSQRWGSGSQCYLTITHNLSDVQKLDCGAPMK